MSEKDAREDEFQDTPKDWASRWAMEFEVAKKESKEFHERGAKAVERFLDKGQGRVKGGRSKERRLNLYPSNVQTLQAIIYGKTPQVDVSRKFSDYEDNTARVAGEMMERLANSDIQKDSDTYSVAMNHVLEDRLVPGMGNARLRYVAEFEDGEETKPILDNETGEELAPAVPAQQSKSYECVEVDYVYWRDQLWSPARIFGEIRWWSFKAELSRDELVDKFGPIGQQVPLNAKRGKSGGKSEDAQQAEPWARANVWEIWDKDARCVWFYVEGFGLVLTPVGVEANKNGSVPDPLGLEGFWPFAMPFAANTTTTAFMPQSDFYVGQDLYNEADDYTTRIWILEKALKVSGVYDKNAGSNLGRLLEEGQENQLIPVDNWAVFAEKGGIKGAIDWLPIEQIVMVLDKLRELRNETIQLLYQVTGFSDIMRGQANEQTTATEQSIKAKFASVRVQRLQDEFARFCSDTQKLKLEIISKHFDPKTIVERSNIMRTPDAEYAQDAVALIKSDFYQFRVEVKPESVSLTDYAAMRSERTEFITGLSQFLTAAVPAAQGMPGSAPFLMQLLQWFMAGFKGGSQMQGVIDQAIAAAEKAEQQKAAQPPQPPPPDPKVQAIAMKGQQDQQHTMTELQADLARIGAQTKAAVSQRAAEAHIDVQEEAAKQRIKDPMTAMLNPQGVR